MITRCRFASFNPSSLLVMYCCMVLQNFHPPHNTHYREHGLVDATDTGYIQLMELLWQRWTSRNIYTYRSRCELLVSSSYFHSPSIMHSVFQLTVFR